MFLWKKILLEYYSSASVRDCLMYDTVGVGELAGSDLTVLIHNSCMTTLSDEIASWCFFFEWFTWGKSKLCRSWILIGQSKRCQWGNTSWRSSRRLWVCRAVCSCTPSAQLCLVLHQESWNSGLQVMELLGGSQLTIQG